jgi:hypothetical protein
MPRLTVPVLGNHGHSPVRDTAVGGVAAPHPRALETGRFQGATIGVA